ncbi:pseudouridine synthase [Myxosarcina sp. GI1]|uniref:pseudouridine synthase n=1 Tax=Myxosarcina sp. GI1 TaxID=1541065 RepID=UPI00056C30E6|nr:pseudouridine synthase [Myxosarcina sp. GI1]
MTTILFYKPYGVLCQFTDNSAGDKRQTLKDYISIPSVYPVGRLDLDSEGLLLLTNNGQLQHRLAHRQFAHLRTYYVQVERIPDEAALQRLRKGVKIKDYFTRPAIVEILLNEPKLPPRHPPIRYRKSVPTCWLKMTLTEGRNRQVRRMTAAVGFPTLRLVRVAVGGDRLGRYAERNRALTLSNLQPGQWRELTEVENKILFELVRST